MDCKNIFDKAVLLCDPFCCILVKPILIEEGEYLYRYPFVGFFFIAIRNILAFTDFLGFDFSHNKVNDPVELFGCVLSVSNYFFFI